MKIERLKKLHKSKQVWFSMALAALAPALQHFPEMRAFLGEHYGLALVVLSAIVGWLRYVTTQDLAEK